MTVFDLFQSKPFVFLEIARGTVRGNVIAAEHQASGLFKLRNRAVALENTEVADGNATMHVKPDEPFISTSKNLVGHGIRIYGKEYEIVAQTGGMNYDTGVMEHYTLTLNEASFVQ